MKRTPLFLKYMLSYLFIFMLPIFLIGALSYQHFIRILTHEITTNNLNNLTRIQETLDTKMSEMQKIAVQIASNANLTPYHLKDNAYNAMEAKGMLNYTVANEFLLDVLLYIKDGDKLYSSVSTYDPRRFIADIYPYENWPYDSFHEDINTVTSPLLRGSEPIRAQDRSLITYMMPIPLRSTHPYGTALFLIDERSVQSMLEGVLSHEGANTVIYDRDGQMIVSLRQDEALQSDAASRAELTNRLLSVESNGRSEQMRLGGYDYAVTSIESSLYGWRYVTYVPMGVVMKAVDEVKLRVLLSLSVIAVAGLLVIAAMMYMNYNPLRRLIMTSEQRLGNRIRSLRDIHLGIDRMADTSHRLQHQWDESKPALREHLLLNLLRGRYTIASEFNQQAAEVGLRFPESRFTVVVFSFEPPPDSSASVDAMTPVLLNQATETMDRAFLRELVGYRIEWPSGSEYTYIVTRTEGGPIPAEEAEYALQSLRADMKLHATAGVGSEYTALDQVGKSYIEAKAALDYKLIKGRNKVIAFEDVFTERIDENWYPRRELEGLAVVLKSGDAEQINELVTDILGRLERQATPLYLARYVCFDMINTVIRVMDGLGKESDQPYVVRYPDVVSLIHFGTIQELAQVVTDLCGDVCGQISGIRKQKDDVLIERITDYMKEGYADPLFSIQQISDQFGMSSSSMRKYFKERAGRTMAEYMDVLRIEEAKRLLQSQELPLRELVRRIGYYDVSSFIRKFKQYERMTPGEYRKQIDDELK